MKAKILNSEDVFRSCKTTIKYICIAVLIIAGLMSIIATGGGGSLSSSSSVSGLGGSGK